MPGIGLGMSPMLGVVQSGYDPATDSGLNFHAKGRSGLALVDRLGNNPSIIPSYLNLSTTNKYLYVADNGGLDIGLTSFSICAWIKNEQTTKTGLFYLLGKQMASAQSGSYGFYTYNNGILHAFAKSSGTTVDIASTLDTTDKLGHFITMSINYSTMKVYLYVDKVMVGTGTSFTGTFPALDNVYKFCIGAGQAANGLSFAGKSVHSCSDVQLFRRALSTEDIEKAYNREIVADNLAYYPLIWSDGTNEYDCSGNNRHLTCAGITSADYKFSSFGSRHGFDCGYDLYDFRVDTFHLTPARIYVGKTIAGASIVNPPIPSTYLHTVSVDGSLTDYNLCNSLVEFTGDQFDRSNATIWSDLARSVTTFYDSTSAATKKRWHSTEITLDIFMNWANDGYKRSVIPKISDTSVYDRKLLTEIFSSTLDKSVSEFNSIIKFTGDNDWYHTLDYSFTDIYICAQRNSKQLTFNNTTKVLSLSLDCGATIYSTKDLTGVCSVITDAYIFDNGNIIFANHTKYYYSLDNLATYSESTVLGIDGLAFVPSTYNNYRPLTTNEPVFYNGVEYRLWGNYATDVGTAYTNINAWFTNDNGLTIKSIYKVGVTSPIIAARHIHGISSIGNGKFIIETGDNTDECNWIESLYDGLPFSFTLIGTGDQYSPYKSAGIINSDSKLIFGSDGDGVISNGIWIFNYSDIGNTALWKKANYLANTANTKTLSYHGNEEGEIIGSYMTFNTVFTSINGGKYFIKTNLSGGPVLGSFGLYVNYLSKNSNGYFSAQIWDNESGESENNWTLGKNLLIKLVKY